jgi:hypothetical protein
MRWHMWVTQQSMVAAALRQAFIQLGRAQASATLRHSVDGTYALRSAVAVRSSPKAAQRCAEAAGLDGGAHDRSTISSAVMHGHLLHQHQHVDRHTKYTAKLHHIDGRYLNGRGDGRE